MALSAFLNFEIALEQKVKVIRIMIIILIIIA